MQKNIHPECFDITVRCACGNSIKTISTKKDINIDICSACHPFFTGTQKFVDTAGRIEKFKTRYSTKATKEKDKKTSPAKKTTKKAK